MDDKVTKHDLWVVAAEEGRHEVAKLRHTLALWMRGAVGRDELNLALDHLDARLTAKTDDAMPVRERAAFWMTP